MELQGVAPSVITCNALISTCAKGEQPRPAPEVFKAMQLPGTVPDVITCNALISTCEKG